MTPASPSSSLEGSFSHDVRSLFTTNTDPDLPQAQLAGLPIARLKTLTADIERKLHARNITTLHDLATKFPASEIAQIRLSPEQWQALACLILYPNFDRGPSCGWQFQFDAAPLSYYQNFAGTPFHTHFGPVFYRGRTDGSARLLVIGQDPSTDEVLGHRAFVGQAGQIAQNFLTKIGLTRSYLMLNTFIFGVQSGSLNQAMVTDPTIMAYRNKLFDYAKANNKLVAILAFGSYANASATNWPGRGSLPIIRVTHPTAPTGVAANWNSNLQAAANAIPPDPGATVDLTPYDTTAPNMPTTDVPRRDLPFGVPNFQGSGGGTRSQRGSGATFETRITWSAP